MAIGMVEQCVLCQSDDVWHVLVVNASRLDEQAKIQIFAVFREPGALNVEVVGDSCSLCDSMAL